jgi:hypothetical protein
MKNLFDYPEKAPGFIYIFSVVENVDFVRTLLKIHNIEGEITDLGIGSKMYLLSVEQGKEKDVGEEILKKISFYINNYEFRNLRWEMGIRYIDILKSALDDVGEQLDKRKLPIKEYNEKINYIQEELEKMKK